MPSTEEQVKNIILKHNGSAHKQQIARELNMGLDYVDLVCRDLERKGEVAFRDGFYSLITLKKGSGPRLKSGSRIPDFAKRNRDKKVQKAQNETKSAEESALLGIPKMTKELMHVLEKAGYKTIESLADAPIARLIQETKLKLHEAAGLINQARKALNQIGE